MFTPVPHTPTEASADEEIARERETYGDDMRGEEMESIPRTWRVPRGAGSVNQIGLRRAGGWNECGGAERAAGTMVGSLRVSGSGDQRA